MRDPMPRPPDRNAALVLADGTVFWGHGIGANGVAVGEVCFNTAITGYQEILTDPSYAGQIITFTFPHIGNVGTNTEDIETTTPAARGLVLRAPITGPANYRATQSLESWLQSHGLIGISGVDTRRLTRHIRDHGPPNGAIGYHPEGRLDLATLRARALQSPGLEGMDLAKEVTCRQAYKWDETSWDRERGYGVQRAPRYHVVAIDYGAKRNILADACGAGLPGHCGSRHRIDGGCSEPLPGWHIPLERPGRSRGNRNLRCAGLARLDLVRQADIRYLPRAPTAGVGARREDPQDGAGAPGSQSPGQGPGDGQGRNHQPKPRVHRGAREPAARRGANSSVAVRQHERRIADDRSSRCFRCNITRKQARGPRTVIICSNGLSG